MRGDHHRGALRSRSAGAGASPSRTGTQRSSDAVGSSSSSTFGRLRQRAGDDDALLFAAAQRRERPFFELRRPGRRERVRARCPGRRRPRARTAPRCGYRPISTMSSTLKSNVACVSCGTTRDAPRDVPPRQRRERPSAEQHAGRSCGVSIPLNSRSSVVLPEPFGPSRPTIGAVPDSERDVAKDGPQAARIRERQRLSRDHGSTTTSSAQQPERCTCPSLAPPERRAEERSCS